MAVAAADIARARKKEREAIAKEDRACGVKGELRRCTWCGAKVVPPCRICETRLAMALAKKNNTTVAKAGKGIRRGN